MVVTVVDGVSMDVIPPAPEVEIQLLFANEYQPSGANVFRWGNGAPSAGLGNVNDAYFDEDTFTLYRKTGVATWTVKAKMLKNVTNSTATVQTPSAGEGTIQVSTP